MGSTSPSAWQVPHQISAPTAPLPHNASASFEQYSPHEHATVSPSQQWSSPFLCLGPQQISETHPPYVKKKSNSP